MNARSLAVLFAALATLTGWVAPAVAQTTNTPSTTATAPSGPVLVYRLTFRPLGDSINFRAYQGGYYVADIANGESNSGTLILTQVLGGTRKYYTLSNYGALFYGVKGGERKAIFSGAKTTTTPALTNITFQAVGEISKTQNIELPGGDYKAAIATKLEGVGIFADSQEDLPFASAQGQDLGTAGMVNVTLTLQDGLTENSLKTNISRTAMVTQLQGQLIDQDYTTGDATSTTTR